MKCRVMVELTCSDGALRKHLVSAGGGNTIECSPATVGLTLADGVICYRAILRGWAFRPK